MAPSKFVGVDGCPYGWFSVGFDDSGGYEFEMFPKFDKLVTHYANARLILVDIPIGLPEGQARRECDHEARMKIGPRRSSVFRTPTRQTVEQAALSRKKTIVSLRKSSVVLPVKGLADRRLL